MTKFPKVDLSRVRHVVHGVSDPRKDDEAIRYERWLRGDRCMDVMRSIQRVAERA